MHWITRRIVWVSLMAVLLTAPALVPASRVAVAQERSVATESHRGFNDQYVFAATRGVNNMEGVHPAFKVTLFPVTIVLDTIFLPFAVIAGFIS